ncbi:hypothetical protein DIPPA_20615 [Diplonema papillatum]|nr:hypothetical protein DIPPA_20615 [Diplonema papillatum]
MDRAEASRVLTEMLEKRSRSGGAAMNKALQPWERESRAGGCFEDFEYVTEAGRVIKVEEGAHELGHRVWDTCLQTCKYIERSGCLRGKSIVELGSGCGLLSIVALEAGATRAVVTDLPAVIQHLTANVKRLTGGRTDRETLQQHPGHNAPSHPVGQPGVTPQPASGGGVGDTTDPEPCLGATAGQLPATGKSSGNALPGGSCVDEISQGVVRGGAVHDQSSGALVPSSAQAGIRAGLPVGAGSSIEVHPLTWGSPGDLAKLREACPAFDAVVATDVTITPHHVPALVVTIRELLSWSRGSFALVAGPVHREGWRAFTEACSEGFVVDAVPRESLHPDYRSDKLATVTLRLKENVPAC